MEDSSIKSSTSKAATVQDDPSLSKLDAIDDIITFDPGLMDAPASEMEIPKHLFKFMKEMRKDSARERATNLKLVKEIRAKSSSQTDRGFSLGTYFEWDGDNKGVMFESSCSRVLVSKSSADVSSYPPSFSANSSSTITIPHGIQKVTDNPWAHSITAHLHPNIKPSKLIVANSSVTDHMLMDKSALIPYTAIMNLNNRMGNKTSTLVTWQSYLSMTSVC